MYSLLAALVFAGYATIAFRDWRAISEMEQQVADAPPAEAEIMKDSMKARFQRSSWLTILTILTLLLILFVSFSELPG